MKKFVALLLFIALCGLISGKQIDEHTAKIIGQNFLAGVSTANFNKTDAGLALAYKASSGMNPSSDALSQVNYFYVFNTTAAPGFVIVSADDIVYPILGYSDESIFNPDDVAPNMMKWLEGYKAQIRYAIENEMQATDEIEAEWQNLLNGAANIPDAQASRGVNPLLQTKWNQSPYYNALCPYDNQYNARTVSGCVATAMAQVMKYWNFPATGSGFHSYNHSKFGTLSANFGNTSYQWSSMPNVVSSGNNAVANLMYHCGVSVDMNYGVSATGGSGAYVISSASPLTHCSEYAFKTYFGYESSLSGKKRADHTDSQWKSLLRADLDAGRPVLYAGFGSGGGHAFVCDGYNDNDYFHFNWGWGGNSDGNFLINALNPGNLGAGGGTGGFNSNQQAIIGVKPPSGPQTFDLKLYTYVTPSPSSISYGQSFSVSTNIWNAGTITFNGDYCAAIFDAQWNFVDFVEIKYGWSLPANYIYTNGITFSNSGLLTMLPGSYYVGIYYRPTGENWIYVGDNGNYTNFVEMTVYYYSDIELNSTITVSPNPADLIQGQPISVNVNVRNDGSSTFFGTYTADLYELDGTWVTEIGALVENNGLPPGYTYLPPYLTFNTSSLNVDPGTYLLAILYKPNSGSWTLSGSYYYQNPVVVTVKAASLQADMYEVNNSVSQAYNLPVSFSGNTASVNTVGSNCHTGTDYDYYKITLAPGFNYSINARLHDSYNSGNGNIYSLDALFSYSMNGNTWSDAYDDIMPGNISVVGGGTVIFFVSPYFTGEIGTYLLDMSITRTAGTGINDPAYSDLIKVFPNPAKDIVAVDLSGFLEPLRSVQVLNVHGQQMYAGLHFPNQKFLELPLEGFSAGVYFVRIQGEYHTVTKKIIVCP
ncbi:MAG: thiol protease/hemagglutinin PrtT [Bacteroidales bacterium]|nr:thiol protease/hemagglutinin PrtT [Bacteroidales bacterium]